MCCAHALVFDDMCVHPPRPPYTLAKPLQEDTTASTLDLSECHVDSGDALPLVFSLARHAAREEQLWVLQSLVALLTNNVTNLMLLDRYCGGSDCAGGAENGGIVQLSTQTNFQVGIGVLVCIATSLLHS